MAESSQNENLSMRIIEGCGHIPNLNGMDDVLKELKQIAKEISK